ncbi:MAG: HNH endonuclease [bacterium]
MNLKTKELVDRWRIKCASARFSQWGNWYASVKEYPSALLDSFGYALFESQADLMDCPGVKVTKQINIPEGISSLNRYVKCEADLPEELVGDDLLKEGARVSVFVNRFERNPKARAECLKIYGYRCQICRWSGSDAFIDGADRLIQVHHVIQLSDIGIEYIVDPRRDLIPVCPNCHSYIHLFNPPLPVEEARKRLKDRANTPLGTSAAEKLNAPNTGVAHL